MTNRLFFVYLKVGSPEPIDILMKVYAFSLYGNLVNFTTRGQQAPFIRYWHFGVLHAAIHTGVEYCLFALGPYQRLHTDKHRLHTFLFCTTNAASGAMTAYDDMGQYKHLLWASIFILLLGISCTEVNEADVQTGQEVVVALKLTGDFDLEVTQDPITKATSKDAYGVNVYYDKEQDGVTDDVFAYGLFDNVEDMKITVLSGYKYRFVCDLIKNARYTLFYGITNGQSFQGYSDPFANNKSSTTEVGNTFIGGTDYLTGLGKGPVALYSSSSSPFGQYYTSTNRFYGETDQYSPTSGTTVEIALKRVVFGAKFVITGVKEGSVKVTCGSFINQTLTSNLTGGENIYNFENPYECWQWTTTHDATNPYTYTPAITVTYTSDRGGTLWNLSNEQAVTFKRNVMTTVNINLNPDLSGAALSITEEPMDSDNDINIGINGGTLIDITVNPNE